jgi:hypothetical protein
MPNKYLSEKIKMGIERNDRPRIVELCAGQYSVKQIKDGQEIVRDAVCLFALGNDDKVYRMKDATGKLIKGPKGRRWEYLPQLPFPRVEEAK